MKNFIQNFWLKSYYKKSSTLSDWLLIFILRPISFLYACGFLIILHIKKRLPKCKILGLPVISVGNLSVGGTGKTVMVEFLLAHLAPLRGGVVLRGYKNAAGNKKSQVVSDGESLCATVSQCGDEAYMLAAQDKIPVAIGKDRFQASALLVEKACLDYLILDDAYQNIRVHRDVNILLIDARYLLSQTTWFPAGFLREKDYTRADIIVMTHAQDLSQQHIAAWYSELAGASQKNIFFGKHACAGFVLNNAGDDMTHVLQNKRIVAMAGIGNILSFVEMIKKQGVAVAVTIDFGDHFAYTLELLRKVVQQCNDLNLDGIVMTSKDWYKCIDFINALQLEMSMPFFYVLRVQFEFLSEQQYDRFSDCIRSRLCVKTQ